MNISSINNNDFAIPAALNTSEDSSKIYEESDSNDDGLLSSSEIGNEAASVQLSSDSPDTNIQAQVLQENILTAFEEFQSGAINQQGFANALQDLGVQAPTQSEDTNLSQEGNTNNQFTQEITSVLFESIKEATNNSTDLKDYASMMDSINEQTQSEDVTEKLNAYTQNLRN